MTDNSEITTVNIRPGTKILGSLRHLNYRAWFALAEFVDNALQSFLANRQRLKGEGDDPVLHVAITIENDPGRVTIRDDAAGIASSDFARAFRPAEVPLDASGLSEFGMGMKSASCWFAKRWTVRTKALGEMQGRSVTFDIAEIVSNQQEEILVSTFPADRNEHFTVVTLEDLHVSLAPRTIGKIREHLRDIYRCYLRDGTLVLTVQGSPLSYTEPEVLSAPYYRNPDSEPITWRRQIELDLGDGQKVTGFAALRREGKAAEAGFALFRRNRLIQGSADEGWKHPNVFGSPNSYRTQRLFGELHLEGFNVSHTKDGFQWPDEAEFAQLLAEHLDGDDLPLLRQGEGHRQNAPRRALQRSAEAAVSDTTDDMRTHLADAFPVATEEAGSAEREAQSRDQISKPLLASTEFAFEFRGSSWTIRVNVSEDDGHGEWLEVRDAQLLTGAGGGRSIDIQISGQHPFMRRFAHRDPEVMQALVRVAASMSIAEALLRSIGSPNPSAVRRTANDLLRDVFSSM